MDYKLNKAIYAFANTIRVSGVYDAKQGGYVVRAEFIETGKYPGMFGKAFCREYYQHNGDSNFNKIPASRRSAKRQAEIDSIAAENGKEYAERHLKRCMEALGITDNIYII